MSHAVENMFYVGQLPWHGLGVNLPDDALYNLESGIKLAGLDWTVGLEPLFMADGRRVPRQATIRSTDRSILGTVGPRYTPLQNSDAFNFFKPFLETQQAALHTAGSLDEGRRVWILAKLNLGNSEIVKGDEVAKYVMLSNSHDGTLAVRVGFTPVRVVCANTLAMAHSDDASKLIRIRHSSQVKVNLEKIREVMDLANQQFEATAEQYRDLAKRHINQSDLKKYIKTVLRIEEQDDAMSTRSKNIIADIVERFEAGKGNNLTGVRGTYWAAYNSVTEWLNYERGHNGDTRMSSLWFGDSATISKRALAAAVEFAQAA